MKCIKLKKLAVLNFVFYLSMIAVNFLAVLLPLNGKSTGELSDQYPNLFTPAGITFSIWSLIYLLLGVWVVYGLIQAWKKKKVKFISKIGYLFVWSSIFNMAWIFVWHYEIVWASLVVMVGILVTLLKIYKKNLKIRKKLDTPERFLVNLPFSIYLGWISVATIANVTILLSFYNWSGFGVSPEVWTIVVMIVAIVLGLFYICKRKDIFYALVIMWALFGIWLERSTDAEPIRSIMYAALIGIALLFLRLLIQIFQKKIYK